MYGGLIASNPEYCIASVKGLGRMKQCTRKATITGELTLYQGMGEVTETFGFCTQHSKAENVRPVEVLI